jgi:uncharacterized membrane protein YwzB
MPVHDSPGFEPSDKRRYWLARLGWGICVLAMLGIHLACVAGTMWAVQYFAGDEFFARTGDTWILPLILLGIAPAVMVGDRLWFSLFVRSGYLSHVVANRILAGKALSKTNGHHHRLLGYLACLALTFVPMWLAWRAEIYIGVLFFGGFGIWLFHRVRHEYAESSQASKSLSDTQD